MPKLDSEIRVRAPKSLKKSLGVVAKLRTRRMDKPVTTSDVAREAIIEFVEKHERAA